MDLFILHRIQQILEECLCKENLRHIALNKVLNAITHVVSNHDSMCLLSETSDIFFLRRVLIKHQIQNIIHITQILTFVFAYI